MTRRSPAPLLWTGAAIALAASVALYRLDALPLEVWDEAHRAESALEMVRSGLSLITTYDGQIDHDDTKPPLLIWLMTMAMRLFGTSEWSARLPSALSAIATTGLLCAFCNLRLKRPFAGFLAGVLLFWQWGYVQFHAARAADYDALMTLWTIGLLLAGYLYVEDPRHRRLWLGLCTAGIILAFLTKSIHGLIFLPVLPLYALLRGARVSFGDPRDVAIATILVVTVCACYYALRETVEPGYFAYVQANDLQGRYLNEIEGQGGGILYYATQSAVFPLLGVALALAGLQSWRGGGEVRHVNQFLGTASIFYLIVISLAATKHVWYAVPLCPLSALVAAISLDLAATRLTASSAASPWMKGGIAALAIGAGVYVFALNAHRVERRARDMQAHPLDRYSFFLRDENVRRGAPMKFVVVHPGYGDDDYFAPTLFYVNLLIQQGYTIAIQPPSAPLPANFRNVMLCGTEVREAVGTKLRPLTPEGECGFYAVVD